MALVIVAISSSSAMSGTNLSPRTPCDKALRDPELHFPHTMRLEPGGVAFRLGSADRPLASRTGEAWTFTVDLTFDPTPDTTIKFAAFNASCGGSNSTGTVLDYQFGNVAARSNVIRYDPAAQTIAFNGKSQHLTPIGSPRWGWIEVWDGDESAARATFSPLIDLQKPAPRKAR
jgi:hypothetical protein